MHLLVTLILWCLLSIHLNCKIISFYLISVTLMTLDLDAKSSPSQRALTSTQHLQKAPQPTTHPEEPQTLLTPPMTHTLTQTLAVTLLTLTTDQSRLKHTTTAPTFGSNQQMAPMSGVGQISISQPVALMLATHRSRLCRVLPIVTLPSFTVFDWAAFWCCQRGVDPRVGTFVAAVAWFGFG